MATLLIDSCWGQAVLMLKFASFLLFSTYSKYSLLPPPPPPPIHRLYTQHKLSPFGGISEERVAVYFVGLVRRPNYWAYFEPAGLPRWTVQDAIIHLVTRYIITFKNRTRNNNNYSHWWTHFVRQSYNLSKVPQDWKLCTTLTVRMGDTPCADCHLHSGCTVQ